jgi:NADH:ubiquinone oxidoreductase subunit 6 (subunit J)
MGAPQTRQWAAAGPNGGDVAYRMQSLTYKPIELSLDESVSLATLLRLWLWAFLASAVVWVFFFVIWMLVAASSDTTESSFSDGIPGQGVLTVGAVLSFVVFWVVLLASRIDEPIDEWKSLVEDKYAAATSAYAAIYGSLRRRSIPVNANAMRIRSDVLDPEIVNNRLVITERSYTVYVSVFPFGTSLYLGWMMWRSRRGATLIGHFVKDMVGGIIGRAGIVNQMLRTEKVRAMREAVHSAVREGAEVAVQGIEVPIAATFGQDVPVQDLRTAAGSMPAPMPVPGPNYGSGA